MPRHLNGSTLDGYLARSLDPPELRAYDAHLTSCLSCALTVEREGVAPERWERRGVLGRLVSVVPADRVAA